jgi:hypothetical protein
MRRLGGLHTFNLMHLCTVGKNAGPWKKNVLGHFIRRVSNARLTEWWIMFEASQWLIRPKDDSQMKRRNNETLGEEGPVSLGIGPGHSA